MTWWEGLPGMDYRYPAAGPMRSMANRAVALACGARLCRVDESWYRRKYSRVNQARQLLRLLEPSGQLAGTDEDNYLRRLALCLAIEQSAPGDSFDHVRQLFNDGYKSMNLVGARR